jgi:hypothetical protein
MWSMRFKMASPSLGSPSTLIVSFCGFFVMQSNAPELRRIYELIGEIATSYSMVELLWYLIFTAIMQETPRTQVDAVFFQWDTSAKQRELIIAVADAAYPSDKDGRPHRLRRRLGKLYAATQEAAGDRNAAIHAVINAPRTIAQALLGQYSIAPGVNPRKPNKLAGKQDVEAELMRSLLRITQLILELEDFREAISPRTTIPQELAEELRKQGFQVPKGIVVTPSLPSDPKAS